jgi:hypothetical protein
LQDREHQRTRLLHELGSLNVLAQIGRFDRTRIEADLYGRLKDWRAMLDGQMPFPRQIVAALLEGRIARGHVPNGIRTHVVALKGHITRQPSRLIFRLLSHPASVTRRRVIH